MRLLLASRSILDHHRGGMEAVSWDLAKAFVANGHQVIFLTTRIDNLSPLSKRDGIAIHSLDVPGGRYSRRWWQASAKAVFETYAGKIDLVMGIGSGAHGIIDASRDLHPVPIIIQSHGTPWGEIISKLSVRTLRSWAGLPKVVHHLTRDWRLSRYSHIVAIGVAVEEGLSKRPMRWLVGDVPKTLIENGIDSSAFQFNGISRAKIRASLGIEKHDHVVIVASRLILQKGVRQAILGFAKALESKPHSHLIIAGSGPDEKRLKLEAVNAGCQNRVHFVGSIDRSAMTDYLSAADVFLFPTLRQEGLALAPLEAAANGLRSVLSKHVILPDIPAVGVDPMNIDDIAEKLVREFEASSSDRRSLLHHRFSLSFAAHQYEELFESLIETSNLVPSPDNSNRADRGR
jgi:glycosyltransferase involved in cell wall biosynthesis